MNFVRNRGLNEVSMQIDLGEVVSLVVINTQTFGIFNELLSVSTNQDKVSYTEPL